MIIFMRKMLHPLVSCLAVKSQPFRVVQENRPIRLPDKPVIYAANHSAFPDGPLMCAMAPSWTLLFAGRQRLDFAGKLFFWLNGTNWVDRLNKADMKKAKERNLNSLRKGHDLIWFPEATWNVTESQLMLPMRWGIIDVAREAAAQIIPVALHYDRDKMEVHIRWGTAMDASQMEDHAAGIRALRDTLAAMRWAFWERGGLESRAQLDADDYRRKSKAILSEYSALDPSQEQATIFQPFPEPETVFPATSSLRPCRENAFLFNKRIHD